MRQIVDIKEIEKKLKEPFEESEIEWRPSKVGIGRNGPYIMVLAYVQARAIMNRLDSVFGINGWENTQHIFDKGVICSITALGITKTDGAQYTDFEPFKGGLSDALKRTAVHWGIGRYLYKLDITYAQVVPAGVKGAKPVKIQDKWYHWLPPKLPSWALPKKNREEG